MPDHERGHDLRVIINMTRRNWILRITDIVSSQCDPAERVVMRRDFELHVTPSEAWKSRSENDAPPKR